MQQLLKWELAYFPVFLQMGNPREKKVEEKMGLPLHIVRQMPVQSSQQTTFWKVLEDKDDRTDCQGKELVHRFQ